MTLVERLRTHAQDLDTTGCTESVTQLRNDLHDAANAIASANENASTHTPLLVEERLAWDRYRQVTVFDGSSGSKPSTEARRYVYRMAAGFVADDENLIIPDFNEFDVRRIRAAAVYVAKQLRKKGK